MRSLIFFYWLFSTLLFSNENKEEIFHKTVANIEAYKEKDTLNLKLNCIRRLTKNLLTPIHKRKHPVQHTTEDHLITKSYEGPLTIKFLLPLSLKKEVLTLLSKEKLKILIPLNQKTSIESNSLEIDRYRSSPKGLFAMKCTVQTKLLTPSEIIMIHLLKDGN